ncbi:uncharacterized protein PV09_02305 [Verruconis gallopava]|uniref:Chloride channel protein n=1 Tax=Verruconis gallopava TaxID=253628 RepID=A0A0D2B5T5_9PEZI|nr:uncharacterized protein PV09_02305 [Verruconis gallopava]KIW06589.1 hypothetical protein PV09_02305 [Verruconis gallopava]
MADDISASERTHLLQGRLFDGNLDSIHDEEAHSIKISHVSKEEAALAGSTVGERLPYNDYTTIDWLHDLVKDSYRWRTIHLRKGLRASMYSTFDSCSSWIAVAIMGICTAIVAWIVDVAVATVSDWKLGYCARNPLLSRENCCSFASNLAECNGYFVEWTGNYSKKYAVYVAFALVFGIISSSATMLTKASLPAVTVSVEDNTNDIDRSSSKKAVGKTMYMAAGSGIPEIKTILSGFVIPNFLDFKVLAVKGFGAVFAVATGMCLGKEGPFVHISTCVGYLVAKQFPKYRNNGRKLREMLTAACAAGLSVAFGAPIGGVLFSYEEISTYFPRPVLWHAFLCSLFAAVVLKALNPTGTGKLVLFETDYGTSYQAIHYLIFILLGIVGGIFGGIFCKVNFLWSKWFRKYHIIKAYPVFEVAIIVLVTALVQFPNILIRDPGDTTIKMLLVDCKGEELDNWVCQQEAMDDKGPYIGWLIYGCVAKLLLTIITFGIKVPSGVIIPALDAGALFGRIIGQAIPGISPGIFAMVGAGAFLGGVSRMTISLCVIMFELTGEIEYIVPHMIAILTAKWVADALSKEGVYDLAQTVLGHPFLDVDHAMQSVRRRKALAAELIPPAQTMAEITVSIPPSNKVPRKLLEKKLAQLHRRGLMDAGLVLVQNGGILQGYIAEGELEFGLNEIGKIYPDDADVRLLGDPDEGDFDLSMFVDRTPVTICENAPMEYAVEMFGKLGLRHICILEEGTSKLVGVVIKKRIVAYLESIAAEH